MAEPKTWAEAIGQQPNMMEDNRRAMASRLRESQKKITALKAENARLLAALDLAKKYLASVTRDAAILQEIDDVALEEKP